jgi:starch synthase
MEIFHIGAECYPVAKVGGLADVVGALPKYQSNTENKVRVVIPCYDNSFRKENNFECVHWSTLQLGKFNFPFSVLKESTNKLGFELYLIEIPELFDRPNIYSYEDDIERFLSFQIATLDWIIGRGSIPDVIHCHDHHTALIPFMMNYSNKYEKLKKTATVITIHNGLYQGQFGFDKLHYLPEFDLVHVNVLEWGNCINSLAAGIKCADAVTTVSPSYLNEISHSANGLESLFQKIRSKSKGILNGIDNQVWNPENDPMLDFNYSIVTQEQGKRENKEKLCALFNLDPTKPLFSFIGRLFDEKGADLLPQASRLALSENKEAISILVLGSGNTEIEYQLTRLSLDYKGSFNAFIGYDEALAHKVYAGSDFLLMPSKVEPCGLNQMYAMRYGTIPIVRKTGGLKDTVTNFEADGNGICFEESSVVAICNAIKRALTLYNDQLRINTIRIKGMNTDHSWESVYQEYIELYNLTITKRNEN